LPTTALPLLLLLLAGTDNASVPAHDFDCLREAILTHGSRHCDDQVHLIAGQRLTYNLQTSAEHSMAQRSMT
jgi:hypothetical protein